MSQKFSRIKICCLLTGKTPGDILYLENVLHRNKLSSRTRQLPVNVIVNVHSYSPSATAIFVGDASLLHLPPSLRVTRTPVYWGGLLVREFISSLHIGKKVCLTKTSSSCKLWSTILRLRTQKPIYPNSKLNGNTTFLNSPNTAITMHLLSGDQNHEKLYSMGTFINHVDSWGGGGLAKWPFYNISLI